MRLDITSCELIDQALSQTDLTVDVTSACSQIASITGLPFNVVAGILMTTGTMMGYFEPGIVDFASTFRERLHAHLRLFAGYACTLYQNGDVVASMEGPAWAVHEHIEIRQIELMTKSAGRLPEEGRWLTTAEVMEYRNS